MTILDSCRTQGHEEQVEHGQAENTGHDIPSIIDTGTGDPDEEEAAEIEKEEGEDGGSKSAAHGELHDISSVVELGEAAKDDGTTDGAP